MQSTEQQCSMCSVMTSQRCKTCGSSSYCSKSCQKADWPVHKLLCSQFQQFSTPPDTTFRLGILFPDDQKSPRFVWVDCPMQPAEDDEAEWEKPNNHRYLGESSARSIPITGNVLRSRALPNRIEVFHRDGFLVDGSRPNNCVAEVTKGLANHRWCGPLLAMKLPGLSIDPGRYINIDMVDFRDVIDLLCSYPARNISNMKMPKAAMKPIEEYPGVRINCSGDQNINGRAKFETVKLPADHPVFKAPVLGISKLIDLPIRLIKCASEEVSQNNLERFNHSNPAATFIQMDADPNSGRWGWSPMDWQLSLGSAIIVHAGRKPIFPQHVDALSHFCRYVMQPLFEDSMGCGMHPESPIKKSEVLQRMTPRAFENFYVGYTNWKQDNDPTWDRACPWPYPT